MDPLGPQSLLPFSEDELEYIEKLDHYKDCDMLRSELPTIREACLRVLVLCTVFLKEAAAFGLCLAEIGEMMSREFCSGEDEPSELELVCIEARKIMAESEFFMPKSEATSDDFQFELDFDDLDHTPNMVVGENFFNRSPSFGINSRNSLSKLASLEEEDEEINDGEVEEGEGLTILPIAEKFPSMSNISMSLKNTILGEKKNLNFSGMMKPETGHSSSAHRSANEQLPVSANFVKVSNMNEEEWLIFLDKFQELSSALHLPNENM